jgi:hypothetical protein
MKDGFLAFDPAARRRGPAGGQFRETLTGSDVFSGRAEERALPKNAAKRRVLTLFWT